MHGRSVTPQRGSTTWLLVATSMVVGLAAGALSLADRAPALVRTQLRRVRWTGSALEQRLGIDVVDVADIPFAWDTVGHVVMWSTLGFLSVLTLSHVLADGWFLGIRPSSEGRYVRRRASVLAGLLIAASAMVEYGQSVLSATRSPEMTDLAANAVGVVIGVGAALMLGSMARSVAVVRARRNQLRRS